MFPINEIKQDKIVGGDKVSTFEQIIIKQDKIVGDDKISTFEQIMISTKNLKFCFLKMK